MILTDEELQDLAEEPAPAASPEPEPTFEEHVRALLAGALPEVEALSSALTSKLTDAEIGAATQALLAKFFALPKPRRLPPMAEPLESFQYAKFVAIDRAATGLPLEFRDAAIRKAKRGHAEHGQALADIDAVAESRDEVLDLFVYAAFMRASGDERGAVLGALAYSAWLVLQGGEPRS